MTNLCNVDWDHLPTNEIIKTELRPLTTGPEYRNCKKYFIHPDICLNLSVSSFNGLDNNFIFCKYIITYNDPQGQDIL